MSTTISRGSFRSFRVRQQSTGGTGIRQVQSLDSFVATGGFLGNLFDSFKGFIINAGQLLGSMLKFSATQIVDWFLEIIGFVYEFNWDISDELINQHIRQQWNSFETRVFGILGQSIGSLVSVGVGGAIAFYINPFLAKLLLAQTADDLFSELVANLSSLVQQALRGAIITGFLGAYKSARQFIKKAYKNPQLKAIALKMGIKPEAIESWGDKNIEDWSFAAKEHEFIESIKDEQLRNNAEEFIEEFRDGARDTIVNMANIWDAMQFQNLQEEQQTVIYQPDRSQTEEFYLHGTSDQILNQAISVNNTLEAIDNRDIGNYVVTEDDQPIIRNNGIAVEFVFVNTVDSPYSQSNEDHFAKSQLIVPSIDKSKFTWEKLTELFRPSAFTDGDFKGEFDLEDGRKLVTRGATKQECKQMAEKLLQLTELKPIGTPQYTERDGATTRRWKPRKKQPMYLLFFYVRNYPRATKYEEAGLYQDAKKSITKRFNFGGKSKPVNFDFQIKEAFSTSINDQ